MFSELIQFIRLQKNIFSYGGSSLPLFVLLLFAVCASCSRPATEPEPVCSDPTHQISESEENQIEEVIEEELNELEEEEIELEDDMTLTEEIMHCRCFHNLRRSINLRDPNKLHIEAGREMGIQPFRKNADFLAVRDSMLENKHLFFVEDGEHFRKKPMYHSYPYLTSEAIELLKEVSERFHEKLKKKRLPEYSIQLTSCLRTLESQNKLRGKNNNATQDTSSHVFGASFDISYWEFYRNSNGQVYHQKYLQNILAKTIREVRNEKKCLVIKETGQFCYHFTVIR